jgi:hypothetical protein
MSKSNGEKGYPAEVDTQRSGGTVPVKTWTPFTAAVTFHVPKDKTDWSTLVGRFDGDSHVIQNGVFQSPVELIGMSFLVPGYSTPSNLTVTVTDLIRFCRYAEVRFLISGRTIEKVRLANLTWSLSGIDVRSAYAFQEPRSALAVRAFADEFAEVRLEYRSEGFDGPFDLRAVLKGVALLSVQ